MKQKFLLLNVEELQVKITSQLDLSVMPISEAAKQNSSHHHYYLGMLFKEKSKLKQLELMFKEAQALAYKSNRWHSNIEMSSRESKDMAILDKGVKLLTENINKQHEVVEYLEGVLGIFNNRGYTLNALLNYYAKNSEILSADDMSE